MFERRVSDRHVRIALDSGETIEDYPTTDEPDPAVWFDEFRRRRRIMSCVIGKNGRRSPVPRRSRWPAVARRAIVKRVPARGCSTCGGEYIEETITERLLRTPGDRDVPVAARRTYPMLTRVLGSTEPPSADRSMAARALTVAGVLLLVAAVTLPPAPADAQAPKPGGVLRFAVRGEPSGLDPHRGSSGTDHMSLYPLYDTLIRFDPNTMAPQPGLAESWETADPKTLVLILRKNVRFHDGTPFNAEAVRYNILRAQDRKISTVFSELTNVESVEVVDPYRVRLRLKRLDSALLLTFSDRAGMMVSPTAAAKLGDQLPRNPVGAGEFRFVKWASGDSLRVERFPDYWEKGRPYLDGMLVRFMPDGDTRLSALRSGQIDFIMDVPPQDFASLKAERGIKTHERVTLAYWRIYLNTSKPPLDKRAAREAIQYALDRPALVKSIMFGLGEPAVMPFPSVHWAYNPGLKPFPHDLAKAKAKLAEAGLPNGFSFDMTMEPTPEHVRRAEAIQAQLAQVGIRVDLKPMELVKSTVAFFRAKEIASSNTRWTGRPDPDQTVRGLFHSTGFYNPGAWKHERLEDLMERAVATWNLEERRKLYWQIDELIQQEAVDVGLFYAAALEASSAAVQGYQPNLLGKPMFRGVWLQK
jgi:peptide/nickel transport system substrate-binding protein